jgi:UDP-N-acetylglucosamine 2-epimerase (non-hydrolysing)
MKKVHIVVGTRPDAIKMAPVYKALKSKGSLDIKLISTGQHKELLQQVFQSFDLSPDVDLGVMKAGQSLTQLTVGLLNGLENLYQKDRPDIILAHGDTTTCYATALSAFYHSVPFFHVEAGLRTYRIDSPFPEEFNRQSVAHLTTHHFAPTEVEKANLLRDGILEKAITVTGGTIHDAIRDMQGLNLTSKSLDTNKNVVVFTLHRREHMEQLKGMMIAIRNAATVSKEALFVCPLHPSPIVKKCATEVFKDINNVILIDPLNYPDFLNLMSNSKLIVTDSGGIQEEASFLGRQTLLLRENTERQDGLKDGLTHLIGTNPFQIEHSILKHLELVSNNQTVLNEKAPSKRASEIVASVVYEKCYA